MATFCVQGGGGVGGGAGNESSARVFSSRRMGLLTTVHTPFPVESDIDFIFRTVPGMRVVFWATEQTKSGRARMLHL